MHQPHFLLSGTARILSLRDVSAMTEDQTFALLCEGRWGRNGDPVCPDCGVVDRHWFLACCQQWRFRVCRHTFSVISGTIFADHKLPLSTHLARYAARTTI